MSDSYLASTEAWRRQMDDKLRAPNSWLALAGLFWLHEGRNRFGADPAGEVILPSGRASAESGTIELRSRRATLQVSSPDPILVEGVRVDRAELAPDDAEAPTSVDLDDLRMVLIRRGERYAIRLWDNRRPGRKEFPGRMWFPVDPSWRVPASFTVHDSAVTLAVPNQLGEVTQEPNPGKVSFAVGGLRYSLETLEGDAGGLFLVFADETNKDSTYPSGRFLTIDAPVSGSVILDFNRAYNPPCAFTDFATCPLPPRGNRLPIRIQAGERFVRGPGLRTPQSRE